MYNGMFYHSNKCDNAILASKQFTHGFRFRASRPQIMVCLLFVQGLFHPARKVREVYWKIYNGLYIGSQVSLYVYILCLLTAKSIMRSKFDYHFLMVLAYGVIELLTLIIKHHTVHFCQPHIAINNCLAVEPFDCFEFGRL